VIEQSGRSLPWRGSVMKYGHMGSNPIHGVEVGDNSNVIRRFSATAEARKNT